MKSIVQEKSLEKGKYFIILGTSLEYNDETYYEQGHAILEKKFYKSIDEAKAHKLSYIGNNYGWMKFYEVEQWRYEGWYKEEDIPAPMMQFLVASNTEKLDIAYCENTIAHFIDFCKGLNISDEEILKILPDFADIFEIELY